VHSLPAHAARCRVSRGSGDSSRFDRRDDIDGWEKAVWVIFLIVLPYIGVLAYLIVEGRAMGERRRAEAADTCSQFESDVRRIAADGRRGPADEIATAKRLLDHGGITRDEYETLKRKALGLPAAEQARRPVRRRRRGFVCAGGAASLTGTAPPSVRNCSDRSSATGDAFAVQSGDRDAWAWIARISRRQSCPRQRSPTTR
jgi:Phospholipase_D-nuclease N-terminal